MLFGLYFGGVFFTGFHSYCTITRLLLCIYALKVASFSSSFTSSLLQHMLGYDNRRWLPHLLFSFWCSVIGLMQSSAYIYSDYPFLCLWLPLYLIITPLFSYLFVVLLGPNLLATTSQVRSWKSVDLMHSFFFCYALDFLGHFA